MIVTDASIIVDLFLNAPDTNRIWSRLFDAGETLHAPALLDVEVAHALRRHTLRNEISAHRGRRSIATLRRFPITRYDHDVLLNRIWDLRENLSAYDAAYVALAEGLGAVLLTRDSRVAQARGHTAKIELI
jgi:predicted nucleic acid-binding protein